MVYVGFALYGSVVVSLTLTCRPWSHMLMRDSGVFKKLQCDGRNDLNPFVLTSSRRPLLTVKTSTYHFCKMSLVKSPTFTYSTSSGSSCQTSDAEPQRIAIEENAESNVINPTEAPQEHGEGIVQSHL